MEVVSRDPFAAALEAHRSRYNSLFAVARMSRPLLDAAAFLAHLDTTLRPVIAAVHRLDPAAVVPVLDVLYDLSLDLVGRSWIGPSARYPALAQGWQRLFIALAPVLLQTPRPLATAITNALYNLSLEPAARPQVWIDRMAVVGRHTTDLTTVLDAGKVLAWRSGMAPYRDGALAACANLPPDVTALVLGLDDLPSALQPLLDTLRHDPWAHPADLVVDAPRKRLRFIGVRGGFRGTGGPFLTPPRIALHDGTLIAWDHSACWTLHADAYGSVFQRFSEKPPPLNKQDTGPLQLADDGTVRGETEGAIFPGLAGASSFAATETTLAVTLPDAHGIYLVGLTASSAYA